ncbi:transcriptional regulator [Campylobacter sp. 19-13652]|uniref:transcriptional regulator n=1 Tax=Campylobacter sp. 19-13652 TaxID=2840180 RepID=UPI001C74D892|nr:transcriptional regulator [Campylobacter sp. 19-13652]BCX79156.1 transcriptional regulator [Campylobacter sp. 19-13652]
MQKQTKRDMAAFLGIDVSTLYNWRKNKPNLYQTLMLGFKIDEILKKQKDYYAELENLKNEAKNR